MGLNDVGLGTYNGVVHFVIILCRVPGLQLTSVYPLKATSVPPQAVSTVWTPPFGMETVMPTAGSLVKL